MRKDEAAFNGRGFEIVDDGVVGWFSASRTAAAGMDMAAVGVGLEEEEEEEEEEGKEQDGFIATEG
jgi:hypothetical protein